MNGEHWAKVRQIFIKVLGTPPDEREALLESLCAGDEDLSREIGSLVQAHEEAAGFLDEASVLELPEIPRYRILRRLGNGGMGDVFLATHNDESFEKCVAVKVLREGTFEGEMLERFRQERRILAALEHPHIVRLLDGGNTVDGRPYLVMEHVEGRPIDRFCDERRWDVEQRLELFLEVCRAVEFAHSRMVVHRDLKAGNILVTEQGEAKLLDFGIAKLLNPALMSSSCAPTATALRLMTPEAASPEQVQGGAVHAATDIYSLGLLLYRLLVGHPAYSLEDCSVATSVRRICDDIPPAPSEKFLSLPEGEAENFAQQRGSNRARLSRRLQGDLDCIVQKALRKEPWRRYGSVHDLMNDLEAHLKGHPIQARPAGWLYNLGKFLHRNRKWAAAALILLLTGGFFVAQMKHQRDLAVQAQERTLKLRGLLVGLFEVADPEGEAGGELPVREVLERMARKVPVELEGEPHLQADLLRTLGVIHRRLAIPDTAVVLLRQARELGLRAGADPEGYATTLDELGLATLGSQSNDEPSEKLLAEVERWFQEAYEIRRTHFGSQHAGVAMSWRYLGTVSWERGDWDQAIDRFQSALDVLEGLDPPDEEERATVLNNLGNAFFLQRNIPEALRYHKEALAVRKFVLGDRHPDLAESANNLATVLRHSGDIQKARDLFQLAVEIYRECYGSRHPQLLSSQANLAAALHDQGELESAEELYRSVVEGYERHYGVQGRMTLSVRNNLASLVSEQGNHGEAAALYQQVVEGLRALEQKNLGPRLASALLGWGNALERQGESDAAQTAALEALAMVKQGNTLPWQEGAARVILGGALLGQGKRDEALGELRAAQSQLMQLTGSGGERYLARARVHLRGLNAV